MNSAVKRRRCCLWCSDGLDLLMNFSLCFFWSETKRSILVLHTLVGNSRSMGCSRWNESWKKYYAGLVYDTQPEKLWLIQESKIKLIDSLLLLLIASEAAGCRTNPARLGLSAGLKQTPGIICKCSPIQVWMRLNQRVTAESLWPQSSFPLSFPAEWFLAHFTKTLEFNVELNPVTLRQGMKGFSLFLLSFLSFSILLY